LRVESGVWEVSERPQSALPRHPRP